MPKKLNSAGQMQNYVPEGNGDASGEYGDNASGSNVHYKTEGSEKTEKGNNISVGIEQKSDKINYKGKDYTDQKEITDIIMKKMGVKKQSENVDKVLEQLNADNIDKDIRNVVLSTLESGDYKIKTRANAQGYFQPYTNTISFSSIGINSLSEMGGTLFHECGHALDHQYNDGEGLWSRDYKSKEFGMSLVEMKRKELGEALKDKNDFIKLHSIYIDELNAASKKGDDERQKIGAKLDTIKAEIEKLSSLPQEYTTLTDEGNSLWSKMLDKEITYEEYLLKFEEIDKKKNEILTANENKNGAKIKELLKQKEDLNKKYWSAGSKEIDDVGRKRADLSDMCEAMGYGTIFAGHGGIRSEYWADKGHEPTECFAEIQSAMGTNKASLELLQKYIPNTIKIYKEIIGEIHNVKK